MKDDFKEWIKVKRTLHRANNHPNISEGEIWWCGIGRNIGVEINGKNETFSRPIIVYKKLNKFSFLAIPLSSKKKEGTWYVDFNFKGKDEVAILSQIRTISVARLYSRIGEVDTEVFSRIKESLFRLYF